MAAPAPAEPSARQIVLDTLDERYRRAMSLADWIGEQPDGQATERVVKARMAELKRTRDELACYSHASQVPPELSARVTAWLVDNADFADPGRAYDLPP